MGLGIIRFCNKFLNRFGLVIKDFDKYQDDLMHVNNLWLKKLNINAVIDVGASTGDYALKARSMFPQAKIVSFEPLPNSFKILKQNFKDDKNHLAYNFVLSNQKGVLKFNESSYSGSSSLLAMSKVHTDAYPYSANNNIIEVSANTLDSVFENLNLEENILLKLDVQGAEALVLKGAINSLAKIKVIFIEMSFVELYLGQWLFDELYAFLKQFNFRLVGIENVSQSLKDGSYLQMDAYFVKNT